MCSRLTTSRQATSTTQKFTYTTHTRLEPTWTQLEPLIRHFAIPNKLGQLIDENKSPNIEWSDAEEVDDEEEDEESSETDSEDFSETEQNAFITSMANFNLQQALTLIPTYDGSPVTLEQFLSSVELLQEITSQDG